MKSPNSQSGFTLIEVLVALIVVAIGLLGLANLQTIGLRNSSSNHLMLQAIWLANDIIDKARSNIIQNDSGKYYTDNYRQKIANDTTAALDLQEWQKIVSRKLPNASITLCTTNLYADCKLTSKIMGQTPYMIKLEWDDPTQSGGRQTLIMMFQVTRMPDKPKDYLNSYNVQ